MADVINILIVEDSLPQAVRLRLLLEREGFSVTVANNGVEALAALEHALPSLIISDVVMPEMNGYELCRRVKDDARMCHIPVILLTALSEPEDVFLAMQSGADNFITKPYENQILLSNLNRILANLQLRNNGDGGVTDLEVLFAGKTYKLDTSRLQVVDFLLSIYESALQKNTELDRANQELKEALITNKTLQANYRQLLETNVDAVVVVDAGGIVRYANPAAVEMLGDAENRLTGATLPFAVAAGDQCEMPLQHASGEQLFVEMHVVETNWDGEATNLAVLRDITEHVRMREQLRQLSLRDELTGLYNRRGFCMIAEQLLKLSIRDKRTLFAMYVDLDGMKRINDTLGHQEGDAALCDIAVLLQSTFRKSDIIGRLGGDEFAVLGFCDVQPSPSILEQRMAANIDLHNVEQIRPYQLAASFGIVYYDPEHPVTLENLLQSADVLMYEQKRAKHAAR